MQFNFVVRPWQQMRILVMYVQKRFKDAEAFDSAGITMQPFVKESSYISTRNQ
jgi:hypothetical protein